MPTPRRRRRFFRVAFRLIAALAIFIPGWLITLRATSPWRVVRTYTLDISSTAPQITDHPRPLRVAAYNIAHGRGLAESNWDGSPAERETRLEEIASLLREAQLDLVVLNEVDFNCTWSGGVNQAKLIAKEAGFPYIAEQCSYDTGLPLFTVRFGNALLSRYPIVSAELVDFPTYLQWEALLGGKKRGLLCTLQLSEAESVRVLAVHLEHRDEATRVGSARMIIDLAEEQATPLIVAGDFNSTPLGFPLAQIDHEGHNALSLLLGSGLFITDLKIGPSPDDLTFPSDEPNYVIDWVLAPTEWRIVSRRVVHTDLSDHRPVIVEMELESTRSP